MAPPDRDAVDVVVGLARTLRAMGVDASSDRVQQVVRALNALDVDDRAAVYWAGRLSLCTGPDDVDRYDRAFAAYFAGERPRATPRRSTAAPVVVPVQVAGAGDDHLLDAGRDGEPATVAATASATEVLQHRDIRGLTQAERDELAALLAQFRMPGEPRRSRRLQPAPRGRIDAARTVRELLRRGGEPARLRRRRAVKRSRRVVLLVDVSGSMRPYADALLRFAHAATRRRDTPTEVFTIGTRLTRITRQLSHRDPEAALRAVSEAVPDWSGGTRLGELLKAFLDGWGQGGMARGAVVVILSDGWERGDAALLGEQMARLSRLAHRVVWGNPRKGQAGYEPTAAGMAAALPHIDDFVAGHSLAALQRLARVVAGHERTARDVAWQAARPRRSDPRA